MFTSPLIVEQIAEPTGWLGVGTWRLRLALRWNDKETIEVPQGFETDFASVLRTPVLFALFGGRGNAAAVLHDWLYREDEGGRTRAQVDEIFYRALRSVGVDRVRAWCMWAGVRVFARRYWVKP